MKMSLSSKLIFLAFSLTLTSFATTSTAETALQETEPLFKVPPGEVFLSEISQLPGERFVWTQQAGRDLLDVPMGGKVLLEDFPVAPGARWTMEFERYDVYSVDAKIIVTDGRQEWEIPRSKRLHFLGKAKGNDMIRAAFSLDPELGTLRGMTITPEGPFELHEPQGKEGHHSLLHPDIGLEGVEPFMEATCNADHLPGDPSRVLDEENRIHPEHKIVRRKPKGAGGSLYGAVIAVDTDNEFNHIKFNNDTGQALAFISDLFDALNVMYERDLGMRLLQGTTFLRLDTDASPTYNDDPWTGGAGASVAQLNEFGNYWSSNYGGVNRVLSMLLSKKGNPFSYSGIAWVNGICEKQNTGGGYSINQIVSSGTTVAAGDIRLVGHELGHNFDSPHTHCYNPPVDECYDLEGGCYSGTPRCPAAGNGTIMSYCHFSRSSCGSSRQEFHPTVVSRVTNTIAAHMFAGCIQELLFTDGLESGALSSWTVSVP